VTAGTGHWGIRHTLHALKSFTKLKHLELSPEVILGWDESSAAPLSKLLPETLESICFRYDFGGWDGSPWAFQSLSQVIMGYLTTPNRSKLNDLTLTCLDRTVKYVKPKLETLKTRCDELGIDFHLTTAPN